MFIHGCQDLGITRARGGFCEGGRALLWLRGPMQTPSECLLGCASLQVHPAHRSPRCAYHPRTPSCVLRFRRTLGLSASPRVAVCWASRASPPSWPEQGDARYGRESCSQSGSCGPSEERLPFLIPPEGSSSGESWAPPLGTWWVSRGPV